ncbi:hypothetical protein IFM89_000406 [Coptis chinensis]|uniref:F-box/LRR-repeat protein 15/At3g58940/PEG3-like LRR domain-containing protein n=1 Tax=Coptis chinensis TaxID=261450 RepID=A0A835HC86_9MAGN|nr:hypothetical protein IFM89_000406 [Coptis chinensis]
MWRILILSASSLYELPHSICKCRSSTNLSLRYCDIKFPAMVHLTSLKTLLLEWVALSPDTFRHLISNCPLLEELSLLGCNQSSDLDIYVENEHLKSLKIYECGREDLNGTEMRVYAPNVISLELGYFLTRSSYCIKNLSSIKYAGFVDPTDVSGYDYCEQDESADSVKILGDLCHVQELKIYSAFIQLLSMREVQMLAPWPINAKCLALEAKITKWELPGIAYLLKNPSKLETLNIELLPDRKELSVLDDDFKCKYDFDKRDYWRSKELEFSSLLQNLKTVKIYELLSNYHPYSDVDNDLKKLENLIELVRFMLRNSKA